MSVHKCVVACLRACVIFCIEWHERGYVDEAIPSHSTDHDDCTNGIEPASVCRPSDKHTNGDGNAHADTCASRWQCDK